MRQSGGTAIEVDRNHLFAVASRRLRPSSVVLDIGSGIQPQTLLACDFHICCEPYEQYADLLASSRPDVVVLKATAREAESLFPARSVDTVLLLDVIEHLNKEDGRRAIQFAAGVARSQVVVFTPLGFVPQGEGEEKDAWGLDGVDWQIHRSGWTPGEFDGWDCIVCPRYSDTDAYGRTVTESVGAFFAILDLGGGESPTLRTRLIHSARVLKRRLRASTPWLVVRRFRVARRQSKSVREANH